MTNIPIYQNYHRHSNFSIITHGGDSVVKNEEYAKRAIELGHGILSGVEHGFQGRHIEGYELSQKYNLKFLFGSEAYFVKNRLEKDRTNNHIILLAKNEKGRKALNVVLSEAFISGYYYVPRLDMELLLSLPSNDVWVTSACIGAWKYEDADNLWIQLRDHFKENFFLEVQNHNTDPQRNLNKRILELSKKHNIKTIFGCDSHYIFPSQAQDRENYLLSKGIVYDDEQGWYMDYPTGQTVVERFKGQGTLTESEYMEAIDNTNIFLDVEEYNSPVYTKEIKMPTLFPNKTKEEKDSIYESLIWERWEEEKKKIKPNLWNKYIEEIKKEISVVKNINHADYFLLNNEIVKKGKEKGGIITSTGRGSAVSFYTSKLLGLTKVDRIASPVELYPERFLSETRILETGSLADFDFNLGNPEVFAEAQKEILGDEHSYPMVAWGTMQQKEAWKMYARASKIDFETANDISGQIEEFERTKRYSEEEDLDDIVIEDYVDKKYIPLVNESKKYLGIYSNVKVHPCFVAGTKILTRDGYKNIEKVNKGEFVFTHMGRWHRVINTMNRKTNHGIYHVTSGLNTFSVTGNHPLLVKNIIKTKNKKNISKPIWMSVEDIFNKQSYKNNYKIGSPINKFSKIPEFDGVDLNNKDVWWIIGRYLGDGYIYSPRKNDYRIFISCNKKESQELLEKVSTVYHARIDVGETADKITFNNKKFFEFLKIFGQYAGGKKIPFDILNAPKEMLEKLLEGYLSADGHFDGKKWRFSTVSFELALGVQSVVHKVLRKNCTIKKIRDFRKEEIQGRIVNCLPQYAGTISIETTYKNKKHWVDNDYAWYNIDSITFEEKNEKVYNFEVEEDNSYTVNNLAVHNCAYLLAPFNIKEEAGLIAMKTAKGEVHICTLIDGKWAEKYGLLKNDLLKVSVVELYNRVYQRIGMQDTHDVNDLWEIVKNDKSVWNIYSEGIVMGVNQVEQTPTMKKVIKYAPKNISELSAFVAAIRPSFKSMYPIFENRESFSYGIETFDKLIQTPEIPDSFIIYQEQEMKAMAFSGIPMDETYEVIKSIAKKRYHEVLKYQEVFTNGFSKKLQKEEKKSKEESELTTKRVWQILEDSSRYSFNASHSLCVATDSLYIAYLKAHYPLFFYEQFLQILEKKGEKDRIIRTRLEAENFFKIKFPTLKFGQDNREIKANEKEKSITMSMMTLKGFGSSIAEDMYWLSENFNGKTFLELLVFASDMEKLYPSKWEKLIGIGYFSEFGNNKKIYDFFLEFTKGKSRYSSKHKEKTKTERINSLEEIWKTIPNNEFTITQRIKNEVEVLGEVRSKFPVNGRCLFVLDVIEGKYSPRVLVQSLLTGKIEQTKIPKSVYEGISVGEIVYCKMFERKPSVRKRDGEWEDIPNEFTIWMKDYFKVSNVDTYKEENNFDRHNK